MESIWAIALSAMQHDASRLERIATNLANVTTPGFKREMLVHSGRPADASASTPELAANVDMHAISRPASLHIERDVSPGTVKHTGQRLDMALMGPGMFELVTGSGPAYSRHGQFHLDPHGRVVNEHGHAVMGEGGEMVLVSPDVAIDAAGRITEAGRVVATVKVVEFAENARFEAVGRGLYTTSLQPLAAGATATRVRQGHLENANVDVAREMVNLTQTMRHFEAMQRLTQGYDELLGTSIRKLGEF